MVAAAGISVYLARAVYMKKHIVAYGYAKIVARRIMDGRIRRTTAHIRKDNDAEEDESENGVDDDDDEGLPPDDFLSSDTQGADEFDCVRESSSGSCHQVRTK